MSPFVERVLRELEARPQTKVISLRVTDSWVERVDALAAQLGTDRSTLIRAATAVFVEEATAALPELLS